MVLLLAMGVTGCATCPPLDEVPIRNAEGARHAILAAELAEAGDQLALPVCIDHVRLGGLLSDARGAYNPVTRGVRLSPDEDDQDLPWMLRHEICHGVDLQNDLVRGREEIFDDITAPVDGADWRGPAEGFAVLCELGSGQLQVLWDQTCPLDPDLRGAQVVRHEAYGLADPAPAAWFEPVADHPVPNGLVGYSMWETEDGLLAIRGGLPSLYVDPWTGQDTDSEGGSPDAFPVQPDPPTGWSALTPDESGGALDDGTQILHARWHDVHRLIVYANGAWAPADAPCPDLSTRFFLFEGQLWSAQVYDDVLAWGRWHAGPRP